MKIAIVGPSPVPFTIGGIENMLWNLCGTINKETAHQADLIKLPSRELSFWDLIETYYQFYKLDLSHFDMVIPTKYPAWMVQHKNVRFYVAHRLRGLYDTYHLMGLPETVSRGCRRIDEVLDYMEENPHPHSLDGFFSLLFALQKEADGEEAPYFTFPGPLIREIVHYMDDFAFYQHRDAVFFSISKTVKNRKEYFPAGARVEPLYLPAPQRNYPAGEYRHLFMVSRLDAPKRIDMLIRAMKYVKSDIPLYIAGTGPERQKLEKLAKGDERIRFLGFVSDEDVERYYADSLVIPYFPYDEDYGFITVEAMMHHKPVITTEDAGGPTEFVRNGETGFCVPFEEKAIAEKIDYFAAHPEEAKRMGDTAYETVREFSWKKVAERLLEQETVPGTERKKITVTSTFPIFPPQGGGQARIFHVYRELAKSVDVEIVSYTNFDQPEFRREIAPGLTETRIPRSLAHQRKIWGLEEKAKTGLTDIAEISFGSETAAYCEALTQALSRSRFCVISHPYLYPSAKRLLKGKPFVYEAHNVESAMKEKMLPDSRIKRELIKRVFETEKACCEESALVMTCSEEDRQKLHELYDTPLEKIIVVPNGVDSEATRFVSLEERQRNKAANGLAEEKIGLFMGSWHGPNLDACEMIFRIAELCPDTSFMLMGSQCAYFKDRAIPRNVAMLGVVSEQNKNRIFSMVDFALNPMLGGSGTNLKMFDYMSAGIPIISTEFGTRGIERKDLFVLADTVEETARAIREFRPDADRCQEAREYVRRVFDWEPIVESARERLLGI